MSSTSRSRSTTPEGPIPSRETGLITVTVPPATGPLITVAANPVTGTEPLSVDFTTSVTRGTVTEWTWDFGDGTVVGPGTDDSPTHVYNDPVTTPSP